MDSQHFCARLLRFMLLSDVSSDSPDRAKSLIGARSYGGGEKRRGAIFRDLARDAAQRGVCSFHYVVAARAVDVDINETRNGRLVACPNFLCPPGHGHFAPRSVAFNRTSASPEP